MERQKIMTEKESSMGFNNQEKKRWLKSTKALVAVTVGGFSARLFMPLVGAVTTAVVTPLWAAKSGVLVYGHFKHRG